MAPKLAWGAHWFQITDTCVRERENCGYKDGKRPNKEGWQGEISNHVTRKDATLQETTQ